MKRKPKIDHLLDEVFSCAIKYRDNLQCKVCSARFEIDSEWFDNSHFYARRNMATRYDVQNCDALCRWCHTRLEHAKGEGQEYYLFKLKQLGQYDFDELRNRFVSIVKLHSQDKIDLTQKFIDKIDKLKFDTEVFKKKLLAFI